MTTATKTTGDLKSRATPASVKPWDARLAYLLILPFRRSGISPNWFTTLRVATGLAAAVGLALGTPGWVTWGAWLFVLSNFLDHTDGELARLTGMTSRFGHYYDLATDAIVNTALFIGIGCGLMRGDLGGWALGMGMAAGVSIAAIFQLRLVMENRVGKEANRQPHLGGFEAEDVLYLIPLIVWLNGLKPFLIAASVGAPLFALWVVWQFFAMRRREGAHVA